MLETMKVFVCYKTLNINIKHIGNCLLGTHVLDKVGDKIRNLRVDTYYICVRLSLRLIFLHYNSTTRREGVECKDKSLPLEIRGPILTKSHMDGERKGIKYTKHFVLSL